MFKYFLYTKDFLPEEAEGMGLFSLSHIVELFVAAAIVALTAVLYKRCDTPSGTNGL